MNDSRRSFIRPRSSDALLLAAVFFAFLERYRTSLRRYWWRRSKYSGVDDEFGHFHVCLSLGRSTTNV